MTVSYFQCLLEWTVNINFILPVAVFEFSSAVVNASEGQGSVFLDVRMNSASGVLTSPITVQVENFLSNASDLATRKLSKSSLPAYT